jgi:predicted dehydrogenase
VAMTRLCLLGAGRWGRRYIDTIRDMEGVALAVLASRNPDSAALAPPGCRIVADWQAAVSDAEIDAVIVATPPHLHKDMALAAIAAARPVLIEKPLTLSLLDALAIETQARDKGVLAMVGHTHLFNPAFRELKRQLPAIGALCMVTAQAGNRGPYRPDVTPLWDWAPHDLSMCLDLFASTPTGVAAERLALEQIDGGWAGDYRLGLEFPGGGRADIHVSNMMPVKRRSIEVAGTDGALVLDDIASTLVLRRSGMETPLSWPAHKPLTQQVRDFSDAVKRGISSDPSLALGREVVRIIALCDGLTGGQPPRDKA